MINSAREMFYRNRHHIRYKGRVESANPKLCCQECGGCGGYTEPVLDFGIGPFFECGFCEGTGLLTPHRRGQWLKFKRLEK